MKKAEEPKKDEKTGKKDDKGKKAKDEKKKEKPAKVDKPSGPIDPLKIPRMLFVLGLIIFFLSTCSLMSHQAYQMKHAYKNFAYSGQASEPIKPLEPFLVKSTELEEKIKNEQDTENRKKWGEALQEYHKSEAYKEYLKDKEAWRKEVHDESVSAKRAEQSRQKRTKSVGKWAVSRFFTTQLGLLLMLLGLALILLKAEMWERIAAILVLGFAVIPLLTGESMASQFLGGLARLAGGG